MDTEPKTTVDTRYLPDGTTITIRTTRSGWEPKTGRFVPAQISVLAVDDVLEDLRFAVNYVLSHNHNARKLS